MSINPSDRIAQRTDPQASASNAVRHEKVQLIPGNDPVGSPNRPARRKSLDNTGEVNPRHKQGIRRTPTPSTQELSDMIQQSRADLPPDRPPSPLPLRKSPDTETVTTNKFPLLHALHQNKEKKKGLRLQSLIDVVKGIIKGQFPFEFNLPKDATRVISMQEMTKMDCYPLANIFERIKQDSAIPALFLKSPFKVMGFINNEAKDLGFGSFYEFFKETVENRTKDAQSKEIFKLVFRHFKDKARSTQAIWDYLSSLIHPNVNKALSWHEKDKQILDEKELPIIDENGAPFVASIFNPLLTDMLRSVVMHKKIVFHNLTNPAHPTKINVNLEKFKDLDPEKQKDFLKLFAVHLHEAGFETHENKVDYYITLLDMLASILTKNSWSKSVNLSELMLAGLKSKLSGLNVDFEISEMRDQLLNLKKIADEDINTPHRDERVRAQIDVILRLASIPFYPVLIPLSIGSFRIDDLLFRRAFPGFFQNPFYSKMIQSNELGSMCSSIYVHGKDKFSAKSKLTLGIFAADKNRLLATVRMHMHFEFVDNKWKGSLFLKKPSVTKNATHDEICLIVQEFATHR